MATSRKPGLAESMAEVIFSDWAEAEASQHSAQKAVPIKNIRIRQRFLKRIVFFPPFYKWISASACGKKAQPV
jgi:hypothetical protein